MNTSFSQLYFGVHFLSLEITDATKIHVIKVTLALKKFLADFKSSLNFRKILTFTTHTTLELLMTTKRFFQILQLLTFGVHCIYNLIGKKSTGLELKVENIFKLRNIVRLVKVSFIKSWKFRFSFKQ